MSTARQEPFVKACALCRGEGLGYMALCGPHKVRDLKATAVTKDGVSVPCAVYGVESEWQRSVLAPGAIGVWVVVVPLLACDCRVRVEAAGKNPCEMVFPAVRSKFMSRLLAATRPEAAAILRGFEQRRGHGMAQVRIREAWPGVDDTTVWRVGATLPCKDDRSPLRLRVYNNAGSMVDASVVIMEDQIVPSSRDKSQFERLLSFSCAVDKDLQSFYVVVDSETNSVRGFDAMNAPRAVAMLDGTRSLADGSANDRVYEDWFEAHRVTSAELSRQRNAFKEANEPCPLFSLVMCVEASNAGGFASTVASVRAQSYDAWELVVACEAGMRRQLSDWLASCAKERIRLVSADKSVLAHEGVKAAAGSYVGLVQCGDTLEPDALWHFAQTVAENPTVDLLYCDEDKIADGRLSSPAFKTFPNYGKLYEYNYLGHLVVVSARALGAAAPSSASTGPAYDYDLALRVFEVAREVLQVPRVLYHSATNCVWDSTSHEGGRNALAAHLSRRGIASHVANGMFLGSYRVCYDLPEPGPKVSVVIPTRDHADLLATCVRSVLNRTVYQNYEIVLVENSSVENQTFELYDELKNQDERVRVVVWEPPETGAFNYSALVNYGVSQTMGEIIVLLNNDTEVIEPRWLQEMLGCLMRPEVGVVGAKLLFGDGLIQHVGMVANPEGGFCHVCQNLTSEALGPTYAAMMPGDYSMVTGACQMVRRTLFEELGGYDEELAVGYNDGDFCLRAQEAGYATTVCAHALLHHREFSTRGRESTDARLRKRHMLERARVMFKHADFFAGGDPALNPNLDGFSGYFTLPPDAER